MGSEYDDPQQNVHPTSSSSIERLYLPEKIP